MKKVLFGFILFVAIFLVGCSAATDEEGDTKNPTDIKNPSDLIDPVDDDDPIVVVNDAITLPLSGVYNGVYSGGEAYSLTISVAAIYSIDSIGDMDLEGTLTTSEGQFVFYNDNSSDSNDNFKIVVYLEAGTYLLGVSSVDETILGGIYSLRVEETAVTHSTSILEGSTITDSVLENETNTVEIDISGAGDIQLHISSSFDIDAALYDGNGTLMAESDNNFNIDMYLAGGIYFLEITASSDVGIVEYDLSFDFEEDVRVYNTITLDSFVTGSSEAYSVMYFELVITEAVTVNIYSVSDHDLEGELYISKAAWAPFEYNDDATGSNYNFLLDNVYLEPGTYYLNVYSLDYSAPSYEIHIDTVVD